MWSILFENGKQKKTFILIKNKINIKRTIWCKSSMKYSFRVRAQDTTNLKTEIPAVLSFLRIYICAYSRLHRIRREWILINSIHVISSNFSIQSDNWDAMFAVTQRISAARKLVLFLFLDRNSYELCIKIWFPICYIFDNMIFEKSWFCIFKIGTS